MLIRFKTSSVTLTASSAYMIPARESRTTAKRLSLKNSFTIGPIRFSRAAISLRSASWRSFCASSCIRFHDFCLSSACFWSASSLSAGMEEPWSESFWTRSRASFSTLSRSSFFCAWSFWRRL